MNVIIYSIFKNERKGKLYLKIILRTSLDPKLLEYKEPWKMKANISSHYPHKGLIFDNKKTIQIGERKTLKTWIDTRA